MPDETQELAALQFAGLLTQLYVDTISVLVGSTSIKNVEVRNQMLLAIRNARLLEVDAIEKQLGVSPTTAEIRRWYKRRLNN